MPRNFSALTRLTPRAKYLLAMTSDEHGMPQGAVLSALLQWFSSLAAPLQAALLGRTRSAIEADVLRLVEKQIAREEPFIANTDRPQTHVA